MNSAKSLNAWIEPYLSEEAQKMRNSLIQYEGLDEDLALAIVELKLTETDLFDLPERKQKVVPPWID